MFLQPLNSYLFFWMEKCPRDNIPLVPQRERITSVYLPEKYFLLWWLQMCVHICFISSGNISPEPPTHAAPRRRLFWFFWVLFMNNSIPCYYQNVGVKGSHTCQWDVDLRVGCSGPSTLLQQMSRFKAEPNLVGGQQKSHAHYTGLPLKSTWTSITSA